MQRAAYKISEFLIPWKTLIWQIVRKWQRLASKVSEFLIILGNFDATNRLKKWKLLRSSIEGIRINDTLENFDMTNCAKMAETIASTVLEFLIPWKILTRQIDWKLQRADWNVSEFLIPWKTLIQKIEQKEITYSREIFRKNLQNKAKFCKTVYFGKCKDSLERVDFLAVFRILHPLPLSPEKFFRNKWQPPPPPPQFCARTPIFKSIRLSLLFYHFKHSDIAAMKEMYHNK